MPFSLFISRWLSLYTGNLALWDSSKDYLTLFTLIISLYIVIRNKLIREKYIATVVILGVIYGVLHLSFLIFDKSLDQRSVIVATLYNGRIFAYLFIGIVLGKITQKQHYKNIVKILLIISCITAVFALLQYLLPKDLMTHFGYSVSRGAKPFFFIDDKPDFPRVMSTIRDPNSYGAFLILPITFLWVQLAKKRKESGMLIIGSFLLLITALFLTFSRGAWLGVSLSIAVSTGMLFKNSIQNIVKKHLLLALTVLCIMVTGVLLTRNSYVTQNVILHKDQQTVLTDPNELRIEFQRKALRGIASEPLGHGPGSAGLAAISNPRGGLLTENYYLQIAYEIGVPGLLIFLSMLILIYRKLLQTTTSEIQTAMIASFWGLAFVALLIHLWSNEAVAIEWWFLAGVITTFPAMSPKED